MDVSEIEDGELYYITHPVIGRRLMRVDLVCDVFIHGYSGDDKKSLEKNIYLHRSHSNLFIDRIERVEPYNE